MATVTASQKAYMGNWLSGICDKEHYDISTLRYALTYMNGFLAIKPNTPCLQLVAITCLWIATKFHEDTYYMCVRTIHWYTCGLYSGPSIMHMESYICRILKWDLYVPLPCSFLGKMADMDMFLHKCALITNCPYSATIVSVAIHILVYNQSLLHFFKYGNIADCISALAPYYKHGAAYKWKIYKLYVKLNN